MHKNSHIIGLMSGTSLDGVDLAYCQFSSADSSFESIQYQLLASETIPYPSEWVKRLSSLENASAYQYALTDVELGHYFGEIINSFRQRHPGPVDYISSHGHTIFHQPQIHFTTQIGDGDSIAAETQLPVVYNFRTLDVALGGQGAPLVPIGDQLLFSNFQACLNLGGFSNISFNYQGSRLAYDVSPCNMALNYLARLLNQPFDRDGIFASQGQVNSTLLSQLQSLDYYQKTAPKSLGKEWFVSQVLPLISNPEISPIDRLSTMTEHIAIQLANSINNHHITTLIITGGGAKNSYLMQRLQDLAPNTQITIPSNDVIDYKEAIIFALLGYLRVNNKINCLRSVTGAKIDSIGGNISGAFLM